jgi:RNA 2',3'-cyclic 3'-phosphodiesterase
MSPTLIFNAANGPLPSDPVFFVLRPEVYAARRIHRLARDFRDEFKLASQPLDQDRLHISLCGLCRFGRLTPRTLGEIGDAAASVTMPPFLAGFGWAESFSHPFKRPLVLRGDDTLAGVEMLHNELVAAMRKIGFIRRKPAFTPHMTLLYDHRDLGEQAVEEVCWTVREFVLICSLWGRHRHVPLARWPLRG